MVDCYLTVDDMISRVRLSAASRFRHLVRPAHSRALSSLDYTDPAIGLSDEQTQILETAQAFARDEFAPHVALWDEEKTFPEAALRKAAELGFAGLYVDPSHGGSG